MKPHKLLGSLALVVVIGAVAACSDDKDNSEGGNDSISKAEFITQANALCATFDGEMQVAQADVLTEDDQVVMIATVLVPKLRALMVDIRELGFPAGDEALIGGLVEQTEDELDVIAADPAALLTSTEDPFEEINAQLVEYGLTVCGD